MIKFTTKEKIQNLNNRKIIHTQKKIYNKRLLKLQRKCNTNNIMEQRQHNFYSNNSPNA